jgi:hypothetical protein
MALAPPASPFTARATAVFNPMASDAGFLQPLFTVPGGDNRNFVQTFSTPDIVDGFHPVTWPGRDFELLDSEPTVAQGGPTLWAFQLPDSERIVGFWPEFRATMRDMISIPALADRPLLLFDIVDTLDLTEAKRETYLRAYRTYAEMSPATAERWRDRAILEPALTRAWLSHEPILRAGERIGPRRPTLRARLANNIVAVYDERVIDAEREMTMQRAYDALTRDLPELFPDTGLIVTASRPRPRKPAPAIHRPRLLVVTVGDIGRFADSSRPWMPEGVRVVHADYFHPDPIDHSHAELTIILGAHRDWSEMIAQANRSGQYATLIISLSTSVAPLLRDLRFQSESPVPTISFFAPYATSPRLGRDPVKTIEPLIGFFAKRIASPSGFHLPNDLPAAHNLLVREPLWSDQGREEVPCRLSARALKAGAVPFGQALLFSQGAVPEAQQDRWSADVGHIFEAPAKPQINLKAKRAALLLLVQRQSQMPDETSQEDLWSAIQRIFEIRGWRIVDPHGWSFDVESKDRKFHVTIVDGPRQTPSENPVAPTPGLTQASVLVVHIQAKRDELLTGNRGQFFHAALDEIALMEPEAPWVWRIVNRQLFEISAAPSQAALRMCATLIVEAVRLGNVNYGVLDVDWQEIAKLLAGPDCERFISFDRNPLAKRVARVIVQVAEEDGWNKRVVIELAIEDRGPVVSGTPDCAAPSYDVTPHQIATSRSARHDSSRPSPPQPDMVETKVRSAVAFESRPIGTELLRDSCPAVT